MRVFCGSKILFSLITTFLVISCSNPLISHIAERKTVTFETNGGSQIDSQTVYRNYPIQRPSDPLKNEHTFENWYTDNNVFELVWNFNTIPTSDVTLYANWTPIQTNPDPDPNTASITISTGQIINGDPVLTGELSITVSRGLSNPVTFNVTVESPELYSHFKWEIAGVGAHAGGAFMQEGASLSSFTIDGENTGYNTLGGHILKLTVTRADNGLKYQVNIPFTIIN